MIRQEIRRIYHAFGYSLDGLRATFRTQAAFRLECLCFVPMFVLALCLPLPVTDKTLLIGSLWLVLIAEVLNSAIEHAIDRISIERHPLSKCAKDMGSAAVFLALCNAGTLWLLLLWPLLGWGK